MWYEQVKLNEWYYRAKFDISHIYGVRENRLCHAEQTAGRPNTNPYVDSHFSCESKTQFAVSFLTHL